jgi:hypothetical protein
VRSVSLVKQFTTKWRKVLNDVRNSQILPNQARKWLSQLSKDCNVAGFKALVKQWEKCINVDGGYIEK